jgi:hypothetical protein
MIVGASTLICNVIIASRGSLLSSFRIYLELPDIWLLTDFFKGPFLRIQIPYQSIGKNNFLIAFHYGYFLINY